MNKLPCISIAGRKIAESEAPYVIAEMSANHNGNIDNAFRIIEAAKKAAALIAERGGKVALYMPHSYVAPHKQTAPENDQKNRDYYVKLGNELNALVIPVGMAFAEAYKRDPQLKLHKSYDGSHPSRAGTYLAAATVYAAVYGRSPVGNTFDAFGEVDPKTRLLLQQVAWDTVKKFYGQ